MAPSGIRTLTSALFIALPTAMLTVQLRAGVAARLHDAEPPKPDRWPGVFSSQMLTNRSNFFTLDRLWYDWDFSAGVGRQVIRIAREDGTFLYDVMPGDGNAYYIQPHEKKCTAIKFGVSILTPMWQEGGEFLGDGKIDGDPCFNWRKGFGIQCTSYTSRKPLQVTFDHHFDHLDPARDRPVWTSRFLTFELGQVASEELYKIPDYCPPPRPLAESSMAEIRRQLTADPTNPPHILLGGNDPSPEKRLQSLRDGSANAAPDGGSESLQLPSGHPSLEHLSSHWCPYLRQLAVVSPLKSVASPDEE